jgi:hypothetical protein
MIVTFWGQEFKVNIVVGCLGAFLIAVLASMFGFGGGPFMVPLMTVVLGLPMYLVVGSSLLAILFNTVMGSARHYYFGNVDIDLLLVMFPAAILAGYFAPQMAKRVNPLWVKRIAVLGMLLLSFSLLGFY